MKTLEIDLPKSATSGPLHLLIDSTGIKVEGEGIMAIDFDRQITEIKARAAILNTFTILGRLRPNVCQKNMGKGTHYTSEALCNKASLGSHSSVRGKSRGRNLGPELMSR